MLSNSFQVRMFIPGTNSMSIPNSATVVALRNGIQLPKIHRTGIAMSSTRLFTSCAVIFPTLNWLSINVLMSSSLMASGGNALVMNNHAKGRMMSAIGTP